MIIIIVCVSSEPALNELQILSLTVGNNDYKTIFRFSVITYEGIRQRHIKVNLTLLGSNLSIVSPKGPMIAISYIAFAIIKVQKLSFPSSNSLTYSFNTPISSSITVKLSTCEPMPSVGLNCALCNELWTLADNLYSHHLTLWHIPLC